MSGYREHLVASRSHTSTSYGSAFTSYSTSDSPRPGAISRQKARPRTAVSATTGDQQIVCTIAESRGVSPIVGLAFVNLCTAEASLCQIPDNQTYERTAQKLHVYDPTQILIARTAAGPKTRLYSLLESQFGARVTLLDRKNWAENTGIEYIEQLAFKEDVEALKVSVGGNYYAVCCLAAVLKYIETELLVSLTFHSFRIRYEPSEGSMMIDLKTIHTLELIQNSQNAISRDCLFGLLNHTLTPMGARKLKSMILQPSTDQDLLERRYNALSELTTMEDMFFSVRRALKKFIDADRVLTAITISPSKPTIFHSQQSINNVILLKQYVKSIHPVYEALGTATSDLLKACSLQCHPVQIADIQRMIDDTINEDITFQSQPLDLRNQRIYAVKSGVNGLLDVARQTYKEANSDAVQLIADLATEHHIILDLKYDPARQFFIRIPSKELDDRNLPSAFINIHRRKNLVECQTLDLIKLNQKIRDSHDEVVQMSDESVQNLLDNIRADIAPLFKISEAISILDMLSAFAHLITSQSSPYCRPEFTPALAIKSGRHPIREKIDKEKYVPNDVYATRQSRLQIITGCNMSGKSSYIRSIALMTVLAQIGCFVPASYASFPISHSLFARVSTDDSASDATTSTFAAEMRETAFLLRNIDSRSLVIVDELGRGTSTRDGLCIAIAVAEALIDSGALVWFVTHFRDLSTVLAERAGVVNLHLKVNAPSQLPAISNPGMSRPSQVQKQTLMQFLYRISPGPSTIQHYGLLMAGNLGLPASLLKIATYVSSRLTDDNKRNRKKKSSRLTIALARKRKLILGLREQLLQAQEGRLRGNELGGWLKKLQDEFVVRMAAIEKDVALAEEYRDDEDDNGTDEDIESILQTFENEAVMNADAETTYSSSANQLSPNRNLYVSRNQSAFQQRKRKHATETRILANGKGDACAEDDQSQDWCIITENPSQIVRIGSPRGRRGPRLQSSDLEMTGAIPATATVSQSASPIDQALDADATSSTMKEL